jgi:hypothetical protein
VIGLSRRSKRREKKELAALLKPRPKPMDPSCGIPSIPNNRWNGSSVRNPKPYPGATFGAASETTIYSPEMIASFSENQRKKED